MGERPPGQLLRTRVVFRKDWSAARSDEEVRVVGSCDELGNWNPSQGHVLSRSSEDDKTLWSSKPGVLIPLGREVEYKYVLCRSSTGDLMEWESREPNRTVRPTGLRHIVEDDNGEHRKIEDSLDQEFCASPLRKPAHPPEFRTGMSRQGSRSGLPTVDPTSPQHPDVMVKRLSLSNTRNDGSNSTLHAQATRARTSSDNAGPAGPSGAPEVGEGDSVIVVFRQLPVRVEKDDKTGEWKVVKLIAGESGVLPFLAHLTQPHVQQQLRYKLTFVGLPGVFVKEESERNKIREVLAARFCIPVFVDQELADNHLEFCVNFLWPVFHNMKVFDGQQMQPFDEAKWKSYQTLNSAYAEVIEAAKKQQSSTLVWVHDYQLLLVPRFLYRRAPDCPTGLFLHCAFPSSEVLSCLPNREDILQGMLSSRVVSFQVFDYLRNFVSCCQLLLGARHTFQKGGIMQIEHENKAVVITADHFVIPYEHLTKKVKSDKVSAEVASIRSRFKGKRIIGCYDKCERFAGLTLKLRLFHQFLSEYKYYQGKVVLLQYVNKDSFSSAESVGIIADLQRLADETNRTFTRPGEPQVVNLIVEENSGRSHRLATLQAMDILLCTSINDGLNLIPFMYYLAHSEDQKGTAIVSEFCGCTRALTGIFKVNPFNPNTTMNALDAALNMPEEGQAFRFAQDHSYVSTQSLPKWMDSNLSELKRVREEISNFQVAGFDACFRPTAKGSGFRHLDPDQVLKEYRKAKSRVLLLDAEGTLAAKASFKQTAGSNVALLKTGTPPDSKLLDCLQTLCNDRTNTVVVVSGRDRETVESWFGSVTGLGLCAEHGFHWVDPPKVAKQGTAHTEQGVKWHSMDDCAGEDDWKVIGIEVMKLYVKRVQGSIMEEKYSGISWNYRGVGAQNLVNEVAMELARFLDPSDPQGILHGYPVKVVCGKGYVEVKRTDIDKGVSAERILRAVSKQIQKPIEFCLAIGDDRSDEDMFEAVSKFFDGDFVLEDMSEPVSPASDATKRRPSTGGYMSDRSGSRGLLTAEESPENLAADRLSAAVVGPRRTIGGMTSKYFTVTVGRKPSQAGYYVRDTSEVSGLLGKLASQTVVSSFSRYASLPTLADMAGAGSDDENDGRESTGSPTQGRGRGENMVLAATDEGRPTLIRRPSR